MPIVNSVQNQKRTPAIYSDILANQPAAGFAGRLFVSEDTFSLYRDNGAAWNLIGAAGGSAVTGTGTINTLSKFTAANVIGDSIITESGAAISIAGTITTTSFIKSGGTAAQFLKADGSIDSNTYLTSAGAVTSITGTANQVIASAATGAVTLSLPQSLASNANFVVGTITLGSAGSGFVTINMQTVSARIGNIDLTNQTLFTSNYTTSDNQDDITLPSWGLGFSPVGDLFRIGRKAANSAGALINNFVINSSGQISTGIWNAGAVTSSGIVTGSSIVRSGGTAAQFLKADGSIDSNTYLTSAGAVTSITGTANQVIASAATGAVVLSLPQSIATTSTVTFGTLNVTYTYAGGVVPFNIKDNTGNGIYIGSQNSLNFNHGVNGSAEGYLNLTGYANGVSQFRDLYIADGKGNTIAGWIGSTKATTFYGNVAATVRLNVGGATDSSLFALNVMGCSYTNSLSPTASTKTTNWTLGDNYTYIFTGATGITATFETPTNTNKIIIVKNYSANTLTIASFNGTTNGIVNLANTVVASISLLTGQVAMFQQSGGTHTFQLF